MKFIDKAAKTRGMAKKAKIALSAIRNIPKFIDAKNAPKGFDAKSLIFSAVAGGSYRSIGSFHHKSLYIGSMWFQDVWNLNIARLERCVIHCATPEGIVPFCAYNGLGYGAKIEKRHGIALSEWEKSGAKMKDDLWKGGRVS